MTDTDDRELTIGEMCEAFDVTPRALRFYESKELLAPRRVEQKRFYSRRERARLTLILRGKRFGFSLEEIRQLLELYYIGDSQITQISRTYELGVERLDAMKAQRDELIEAIADLERQLEWGREVLSQRGIDIAAQ